MMKTIAIRELAMTLLPIIANVLPFLLRKIAFEVMYSNYSRTTIVLC